MPYPIDVEGSYNVRDLGGFRTAEGRLTRQRVLIRAGSLDKVSEAAQQQLLDYGVKTIIDLRDEWEAQAFPNVFAHSAAIKYRNMPFMGDRLTNDTGWKAEAANIARLEGLYHQYLEHCQPQIGAIMTTIVESETTVLFHCFAGKDRTGIITGLLLSVVGVPDAVIADDYAETSQHIAHLIETWREFGQKQGFDMRHFERDIVCDAPTMLGTLNYLRQRWGDANHYLYQCGVTEQHIAQLRTRFV